MATRKKVPGQDLESQALVVAGRVAIAIRDREDYEVAVARREQAKNFIENVDAIFQPIKEKAYAAYKAVLDQVKKAKEPVVEQLAILDGELAAWHDSERLRVEREESEARCQAALEAERLQAAKAEEARAMGYDEDSVQALLETPLQVSIRRVEAITGGVTARDAWSAEVIDLLELVKFVAGDRRYLHVLRAVEPELNKLARAMKENMDIPGVKAVRATKIATKRR
jgi:hypothetical protein